VQFSTWGYLLPFQRGPANRSGESPESRSSSDPVVEQWMQTVRGEFLEVPGLLLTRDQVQRLWDLDDSLCDTVLEALVQNGFLQRTDQGAFVRAEGRDS
jgi:hypothetical protein